VSFTQYQEVINDTDAAEGAEQVVERQQCCAKASVFTGFVLAGELSSC